MTDLPFSAPAEDSEAEAAEASPPLMPLFVGAGLALIAAAAWWLPGYLGHVTGYVAGSIGVITAVAMFRRQDLRLRASKDVVYRPSSGISSMAAGLLVVGLLVSGTHVWWIASEVAAA